MDDILDKVRDAVQAPIDFDGQHLADLLMYALLSTFGVISFVAGYVTENVYVALYVGLAGLCVAMLAIVPPWPVYNKNPVEWLPPRSVGGVRIEVDGKKVS